MDPPNSALVELAAEFARVWGGLRPGLQHFQFENGAVCLTLAIGQVLPMLKQLTCVADAVYLDGFSPAKNPEMWSQPTLEAVAAHCSPGCLLASYSVAASVRKVLTGEGFAVKRCPGVPPKWQRLEALFVPTSGGN